MIMRDAKLDVEVDIIPTLSKSVNSCLNQT